MQTKDRKTQTLNTIFIFIFCAFLFCVFILNIKSLWGIISQKEISIETWKQTSTTIESEWKNEIVYSASKSAGALWRLPSCIIRPGQTR